MVYGYSAHLDKRLDWLLPHLWSVIGGYQLRLGDRDKATTNLRVTVERMERSRLKPPCAGAGRGPCATRTARRG